MIVVACPVLGRPQNVRPLILSLSASLANVPCRLLFLASPDDPKEIAALEEEEATHSVMEWPAGHGDFARKINWAFSHSEEEWIFFCGDDVDFGYAWADNALALARQHGVVGTNDMVNPEVRRGVFSTHSLVSRRYVTEQGGSLDGPGTIFHEGYSHNWCDRELCVLAKSRGEFVFARNSVVRHRHPHWGTAQMDRTYRKGLSSFGSDRKLFTRRMRSHGIGTR